MSETYYKIKGSTLSALADRVRVMSCTSEQMTPAQMLEALNNTLFTGQAYVGGVWSPLELNVSASAVGETVDATA